MYPLSLQLGRIDTAKPFADLEKLSRVNERAHAADKMPPSRSASGKGCQSRRRCRSARIGP
jgi:hypothetical protein